MFKLPTSIALGMMGLIGVLLFLNHPGRAIQVANYLYFLIIGLVLFFLRNTRGQNKKTRKQDHSILHSTFYILLIIVPAFFAFRSLFSLETIAFGDAPHFLPVEMRELVSEPYAWTSRGENLGGVDPRIYIWPLLVIFGGLGKLGLSSEIIVRILFYFPAVILAVIGPVVLARYLKQSKRVSFFASLFYLLNTYFLLVIDGGQVGFALAYGLFPISIWSLTKLIDNPSVKSFYFALFILLANTIADPRVALVSLITLFLWMAIEKLVGINVKFKNIKFIFILIVAWAGVNMYWIIPLLRISSTSLSTRSLNFQFLSLLNGLTLFSPHWPDNIFGQIGQPSWFFIGIPIILFIGLLFSNKSYKVGYILVLVFVFLAKGGNFPFGSYYSFLVNEVPFGSIFRDSSKFFIPLMLFGGLLIGQAVQSFQEFIQERFKVKSNTTIIYIIVVYGYLLLIVSPALLGNMNFVLSGRRHSEDISKITDSLIRGDDYSRTAWFPERHPLALEIEDKQALDAKYLADLKPLSDITAGSSDKFNYMYQGEDFLEWYRLLGVKYLVFSGDNRNLNPNEEEIGNWNRLLNRAEEIEGLQKKDWSDELPVYEIQDARPQVYAVDSLALVVGPMLSDGEQFVPAIYFEDGKFDPLDLESKDEESATIVFNGTDEDDLTMSFLQEYFVGVGEAIESNWSNFTNSQYLESKYQLLIRDIVTRDFDYGMGLLLSDTRDEKIHFTFDVPSDSDYVVAVRSMGDDGSVISIKVGNEIYEDLHGCDTTEHSDNLCRTNFKWLTKGVQLKKGKNEIVITNALGTNVVNVVAVVPVDAWNEAQRMKDIYTAHFGATEVTDLARVTLSEGVTLAINEKLDVQLERSDLSGRDPTRSSYNISEIDYEKRYPTWYDFDAPEDAYWVVLADSYHEDWKLKRGVQYFNSLPLYSTINAFYVQPNWTDTSIRFVGQDQVRWGIYYSAISILVLTIGFIWFYPRKTK